MFLSTVASQYFVGSRSPSGHSIKSVSSPRFAAPLIGAVRTRTRAKRERSLSFVPSRLRPVGGVVARTNWRGCLEPSCELPLTRGCHMGYRHDFAHSHCDLLAGGPNGYNSRMALIANPNC